MNSERDSEGLLRPISSHFEKKLFFFVDFGLFNQEVRRAKRPFERSLLSGKKSTTNGKKRKEKKRKESKNTKLEKVEFIGRKLAAEISSWGINASVFCSGTRGENDKWSFSLIVFRLRLKIATTF